MGSCRNARMFAEEESQSCVDESQKAWDLWFADDVPRILAGFLHGFVVLRTTCRVMLHC